MTETAPSTHQGPGTETTGGPDELELELLPLAPALEAVLMVADQPLDHLVLAQAVGHPPVDVQQALAGLAASYDEEGRGFELRHVAGGWRFYTRALFAPAVERFVLDGQQARLTQAALETVAVVAYRQPISRARVSAIRGVNVDGVMRTLVTRGLVHEVGHDAESGAVLYGTTAYFCERMGLSSLDELPEIAHFLPAAGDVDEEPEVVAVPAADELDPVPDDAQHDPPTPHHESTEEHQP